MSESEDEDLRRAIALSLQDQNGVTAGTAIALDNDNDLKIMESTHNAQPVRTGTGRTEPRDKAGLLGLDRHQMEVDRLARLKRKRGNSALSVSQHLLAQTGPESGDKNPPMRSVGSGGNTNSQNNKALFRKPENSPQFTQGAIMKTAVVGSSRTRHDITLAEVLQASTLRLAVLSSFQWDIEWLFSKVDVKETLITLVMQAKDEATKLQYRAETADNPRLRLCFPKMDGGSGCMHSKLMLLSYSSYLRIVIPTANLVPYDWGETGSMENMVFIIDLPRLHQNKPQDGNLESLEPTLFQSQLIHFLTAMDLDQSIIGSLKNFDFSKTKNIAFIHNIAGSHSYNASSLLGRDQSELTGHLSLARSVRSLSLSPPSEAQPPIEIDYVTSSIGNLNSTFLNTIYNAFRGQTMLPMTSSATSKGASSSKSGPSSNNSILAADSDSCPDSNDFRIYFPTGITVTTSKAGFAGTICLSKSYYDSPTFPRSHFRDCRSVRPGVLMHNKLVMVRPRSLRENEKEKGPTRANDHGWAYLGSANLSESAWGNKLTRPRGAGTGRGREKGKGTKTDAETMTVKMHSRNWECGVLFRASFVSSSTSSQLTSTPFTPTPTSATTSDSQRPDNDPSILEVPLPMQYPARRYLESERPWFFVGSE